jgi:hypothetical protein
MKSRILIYCLALLSSTALNSTAQVTGGKFAFEYLRMSNSPQVSALGGIAVAATSSDINLAMQNPSLMRPELHNQISFNYNSFYAGISNSNIAYGYYAPKLQTAFALGVQYLNYGSFQETNVLGNNLGEFRANDYSIRLTASRQYKEKWRYGATIKMAQSKLGQYSANAFLADVGVTYFDTGSLVSIGAVAKNMGFVGKSYLSTSAPMALPFDLQLGISKRFKHLPLKLFATAHHLYEWNILYNNPADNTSSFLGSDTNNQSKNNFGDKLFRHLIFGAQLTIAKRITITGAYNHLRRKELAYDPQKGGAGYSFGASIYLNKFQVHYAFSHYGSTGAYHEVGLNIQLNKLINGGQTWSATYPGWEPK